MWLELSVGFASLCVGVSLYSNNVISTRSYTVKNSKIPQSFDGYKILQLSDLHNKRFGRNQEYLLSAINKHKPDAVVITGDIVYRNYTRSGNESRVKKVIPFVKKASRRYPLYYVTGNHEVESGHGEYLWKTLEDHGARLIHGKTVDIVRNNEKIALIGAWDPFHYGKRRAYDGLERELKTLCDEKQDCFRVVLSHRPEILDVYARCGAELVLTGHAHGGQIRIPFTPQGLFAPDQGVLPKYTEGRHVKNGTEMIISRGLGNSGFPQRLFDRPELVLVTLKAE